MTGMFIIRALEFCNMSLYRNIHAKRGNNETKNTQSSK